jgi:hypothetical protein
MAVITVAATAAGCTTGRAAQSTVAVGGQSAEASSSSTATLLAAANDLFTLQRGGYNEADFTSGWTGIKSRLDTATAETSSAVSAIRELRLALRYDQAGAQAWQGLIADEDGAGTVPGRWVAEYPDLVLLLPDGFPSGVIDYGVVSDYCLARAAEHAVAAIKLLGGPAPDDSSAPLTRPTTGSVEAAVLQPVERRAATQFDQDVWLWPATLRIQGTWAWVDAYATQPGGLSIDWTGIAWFGAGDESNVVALLHKSGGRWAIVRYQWSPSDVYWEGWLEIKGVPKTLFR